VRGDRELVAASGPGGNPKGRVYQPRLDCFPAPKCLLWLHFGTQSWTFRSRACQRTRWRRLRERAKANHRSLQGELRALIDEATGTPRRLGIDEIVARVRGLNLTRRDEAARLIREDRDR